MCSACPKQLGDADHVAGYPINMHWEKKGQTLGQTNTNVRKLKSENEENSNCVKEKPKAANKKNVSKNKCVCASKNCLLQC